MADQNKSSIDSEVDAYFKKNHPEPIENFYSFKGSDVTAAMKAEEEKLKAERERFGIGAAAGAYATHKDLIRNVGRKFFSPGNPDIYGPRQVPGTMPSMPRVEPSLPVAPQANLDSETQKIMQSIKGEGSTGKQRERGHNWETNREGIATRQNLTAPGAPKVVVDAGPMTPTRGGIAIPQGVAQTIEDEDLLRQARQNAQEAMLKREAELLQHAEDAKRARAAEEAARSASRTGKIAGIKTVGLGALGGGLSALDLYDLLVKDPRKMKDFTDEDYVRLIGGLGGLASTIPTPMTQAVGLGTAGLSMAYPYAKEFLQGNKAPKR